MCHFLHFKWHFFKKIDGSYVLCGDLVTRASFLLSRRRAKTTKNQKEILTFPLSPASLPPPPGGGGLTY